MASIIHILTVKFFGLFQFDFRSSLLDFICCRNPSLQRGGEIEFKESCRPSTWHSITFPGTTKDGWVL